MQHFSNFEKSFLQLEKAVNLTDELNDLSKECQMQDFESSSEGIPVSIMEALSAGIPILATNVGGTAEAVNKSNGFLVEENVNIKNTAHIISNYLSSSPTEQEAYRKNAYHFWQQNYEATKNYIKFYEIITKNYAF